ncbi:MAG: hypothetical protein ACXVEX_13100 [Actinomycetota bacterium]
MPIAQRSAAIFDRAIEAVQNSTRIDTAVARLAGVLYPELHVARVSVRMFLAPLNEVVVVAMWCAYPTRIVVGTRMRAPSTSFLDVVREGGVVCGPRDGVTDVTEDVVFGDGETSWVSVPLPSPLRPQGVLTVDGASTLLHGQKDFFADLGLLVGNRLALLGKSSVAYMNAMQSIAV